MKVEVVGRVAGDNVMIRQSRFAASYLVDELVVICK